MGGRYQITHVYLSGHGALVSGGADGPAASSEAVVDSDSFRTLLMLLLASLSLLSPGVVGVLVPTAAVLKSKAVPGVLGVLLADPNDANAPEPRPNADEPAVVGDDSPGPVMGERALNGLRPPCEDESPPKRFVAENVRWGGSGLSLLWPELVMDRESLLVLCTCRQSSRRNGSGGGWGGGELWFPQGPYFERLVHRLSLLSIGYCLKRDGNIKD